MAFGLLEEVPVDRFASMPSAPVRPGATQVEALRGTTRRIGSDLDPQLVQDAIEDRLMYQMEKARSAAEISPSATTFAKLAQAELDAGLGQESVESATRALEFCVSEASDVSVDVVSARIAADVMKAGGASQRALDLLAALPESAALNLVQAMLEAELGQVDKALVHLRGLEGSFARSNLGYLLIQSERYQEAAVELRAALREYPDDPDAAMNLAIALWNIGGRRKALRFALRAVRSAPSRRDLCLRYLDLLLEYGDAVTAQSEVKRVQSQGVEEDSKFLVFQARTLLALGERSKALSRLDRALELARNEGDDVTEGEVAANRVALRYDLGKVNRGEAWQQLANLLEQFPGHDAVLMNAAYMSRRVSERPALARSFELVKDELPADRRVYIAHRLAYLSGDLEAVADASRSWLELAPLDSNAAAEYVQSVGIGLGDLSSAAAVASRALRAADGINHGLLNNAAYVFAMAGDARTAIDLLEASPVDSYALKATLGLAYMAAGDLETGMRQYRQAAEMADRADRRDDRSGALRSLMTAYQALIVRQLGLLDEAHVDVIRATALPSVPLPSDWEDRPEFLLLKAVAERNGFSWPLELP